MLQNISCVFIWFAAESRSVGRRDVGVMWNVAIRASLNVRGIRGLIYCAHLDLVFFNLFIFAAKSIRLDWLLTQSTSFVCI